MSTFTDAPFMPAADKRRVLTQWRHFLQTLARHFNDKDRSFRAFSDALYRHLIQHCSFIAHYSRSGFFAHYFDRGDDAIRFLRQFDPQANPDGLSVEYGKSWWLAGEYADINEAMREATADFVSPITAAAADAQRNADIARARRLAARHGLSVAAR